MFEKQASAAELAAFGLRPEDYAHEVAIYWPDCAQAVQLFNRMQTQWRAGSGGAFGLDYLAAYPLLDRMAQDKDEWDSLLDDLRVMEDEALAAMHEKPD